MNIFITDEFVSELKTISKNKSHSDCETDLINAIFKKTIEEIKNVGTIRLGGQADKSPFLRKRISSETSGKSSGYRLYFWLFIHDKNIFLLFIHPKTGRRSASNISTEKQKDLVKTFRKCRDEKLFYEVGLNKNETHLIYIKTRKKVLK